MNHVNPRSIFERELHKDLIEETIEMVSALNAPYLSSADCQIIQLVLTCLDRKKYFIYQESIQLLPENYPSFSQLYLPSDPVISQIFNSIVNRAIRISAKGIIEEKQERCERNRPIHRNIFGEFVHTFSLSRAERRLRAGIDQNRKEVYDLCKTVFEKGKPILQRWVDHPEQAWTDGCK